MPQQSEWQHPPAKPRKRSCLPDGWDAELCLKASASCFCSCQICHRGSLPAATAPTPFHSGAVQEKQSRSTTPTSSECPAFGGLLSCCAGINLPWNATVKEGAWHQVKIAQVVAAMCICAEQKSTIV